MHNDLDLQSMLRSPMSKRKISASTASDDDGDSSDVSVIDVSFDFFDPNPTVDYHAIKHLLAQLFHHDTSLFSLHELTELILSQPTVGTTIKTDGLESDPYALLTVLNMHVHHVNQRRLKFLLGVSLNFFSRRSTPL